jgi:hypothetical protein
MLALLLLPLLAAAPASRGPSNNTTATNCCSGVTQRCDNPMHPYTEQHILQPATAATGTAAGGCVTAASAAAAAAALLPQLESLGAAAAGRKVDRQPQRCGSVPRDTIHAHLIYC